MTVFFKGLSRSLNLIFDIIYWTKHYTNDDDNSHITAILKWNINIAATLHLQCFERTLEGSCKILETFLTAL